MGQSADSNRNAALDNDKERGAGRRGRTGQSSPEVEAIKDAKDPLPAKGHTGGAHGKDDAANRVPHAHTQGGTQGGGGGGGAQSMTEPGNAAESGT